MPLDDTIQLRISSEDLPLIERVLHYRYIQGVLGKETLSEYIRYLINRDMNEVHQEIKQRRS